MATRTKTRASKAKPRTWVRCAEGIEKKVLTNGDPLYRVRWREGGGRTGPRDDAYFDEFKEAESFRGLLIANGRRDPRKHGPLAETFEMAPIVPLTGVKTFGAAIESHLAKLAKLGKAKERQIACYRRLYEHHIRTAVVSLLDDDGEPTGRMVGPLGSLPVDEFTAEVDEAWIAWMASRTYVYRRARTGVGGRKIPADKRTYSAKTIHNIHGGVISPAMSHAAQRGWIDSNPCAGVQLPDKGIQAVSLDEVPTGSELYEWIRFGYAVSTLAGDIITIAIGTGLRWSEILALRPCDINLKKQTLRVAQAVKEDGDRQLFIAPYGKTDAARRTIRFSKTVRKVLKRVCEGRGKKELIIQRVSGGILRSAYFNDHHWVKVVELARAAGITTRATIHKFRHSHATELLAANVSLDQASKRLGHKSIVVTSLLYRHLQPEADERAANVIELVMLPKKKRKQAEQAQREADEMNLAA